MNAICNQWEDAKDVPHSGTSATATDERHVEHICAVLKKDPSKISTVNGAEVSIPAACFTFSLTTLEAKGLYKADSTHAE
jgi:predicted transcriptional regulator